MPKILKQLAVATSSYADQDGVIKNRYRNVGVMMEDKEGRPFILLDRDFNPAGVPFKQGADKVLISCFNPKTDGENG